jgi:hypothetical protein
MSGIAQRYDGCARRGAQAQAKDNQNFHRILFVAARSRLVTGLSRSALLTGEGRKSTHLGPLEPAPEVLVALLAALYLSASSSLVLTPLPCSRRARPWCPRELVSDTRAFFKHLGAMPLGLSTRIFVIASCQDVGVVVLDLGGWLLG